MNKQKLNVKAKTFLATDLHTITAAAEKLGLKLPSNNVALFQSVYAPLEDANLNGVRLSTAAVYAAIDTLRGAQANLNHSADMAPLGMGFLVGIILDAWVDEATKEINIIFTFAKNVYQEDYLRALDQMNAGTLSVSFELLADRESQEELMDGTVRLHDIEFTGVGLLLDASPAYPKAKVYEMAKTYKTRAEKSLQSKEKDLIYASEIAESCEQVIANYPTEVLSQPIAPLPLMDCSCPHCYSKMTWENTMYDADYKMYHKPCIDKGPFLTPGFVKAEEENKIPDANVELSKQEDTDQKGDTVMEEQKPVEEVAVAPVAEVKVEEVIVEAAPEAKVEEIVQPEAKVEPVAEVQAEEIKVEDETAKKLAESIAKIAELEAVTIAQKTEIDAYKQAEAERQAALKAEKISKIKTELSSNPHAKDFSDEDYLNEAKVEQVKILKERDDLKAENEALKAKKTPETAEVVKEVKEDNQNLVTGTETDEVKETPRQLIAKLRK